VILSDQDIKKRILDDNVPRAYMLGIDPFDEELIQPASVDFRIGDTVKRMVEPDDIHTALGSRFIDPRVDYNEWMATFSLGEIGEEFLIPPGQLVLVNTYEYFHVPIDLAAEVAGKSSLGRLGLSIHVTAGFLDPGWEGNITLELTNFSHLPIVLYHQMKIGQIIFHQMTSDAEYPYGHEKLGSKYQGDTSPETSKMFKEFENG
tara:strand:+ start:14441 stop:15052 length:612 start_codon:yes stop_codon:yes gene_type:complete